MKKLKRILAVLLTLCLLFSMVPMTASATETGSDTAVTSTDSDFQRILHLDCGRKYFTKDWIIALINEMAAAGYTHLQLAFGNDGLRFLLDDMSVTVGETTYSSADVTEGIQAGNEAYYDAGDKNELTQSEMDEIIAHANSVGIEIVPHMNMPGHMDAILDAIEYVGISDAHFTGYTGSDRSLNLSNDTAANFAKALLEKYVAYFDGKGCTYFHIGADEFGNDAYNGGMGFPNMDSTLYTKFANYVNACAAIVEDAGMTARAWNDGISYTSYSDSFDTDIQITYWSSGWSGYNVASASTLSRDHDMINTHGDYYYVLGKNDLWTPDSTTTHDSSLYTSASAWSNTTFMGSTVSDPIGSMFCIWCDYPEA
ncbi:MAG: family 20 glycosylhydrolase, partial [Clostridia bacterium]|nr:family 20 glycosylhydrolase [Clostridia bacterium]